MKKIALLFLLIFTTSSIALADEEILTPKYDGRFFGITINAYGFPSEGKEIEYKKTISKKLRKYLRTSLRSACKASECNIELAFSFWTKQKVTGEIFITNTFKTVSEGFLAITQSSKDGFGGLKFFDYNARKHVSLDIIFSFPGKNNVTMAIGHCGDVYALVRTLDEASLQAAFAEGERLSQLRAECEEAEAAAIAANLALAEQQIASSEYTDDGAMIVVSTY